MSASFGAAPQQTAVHIGAFPFLARLGSSGNVATLRASVSDVEVSGLRFATIAVNLQDVHLDRDVLVFRRQVEVKRIGYGQATADITQAALRGALNGLPVVLGPGTIGVTVGGVTVSVSARVTNGVLRLAAAGVNLPAVTLPRLPLLPCVTEAVSQPGLLHLSCTIKQVPAELLRHVSPRT